MARDFHRFSYKDARYKISSPNLHTVIDEIVRQRSLLEEYIRRHPRFGESLEPLSLGTDPPEIAMEMHAAADKTGVGPMAAVAGAIAERAARSDPSAEAVIDNGGDIFIAGTGVGRELTVGIWAGDGNETKWHGGLAFRITADDTPLSICSSSGRMGHSLSLGRCDLATVVSSDGALADAAATLAANLVTNPQDIQPALERVGAIEGIDGVVIVCSGSVGFIGKLPTILPYRGSVIESKIIGSS